MILLLSALSCAAWLYLIVFHGRFWVSGPTLHENGLAAARPHVAIVVPARNEAESIAPCLQSLLTQEYAGELSVILVDDNSDDGTAEIAASLPLQSRLTLVSGKPLPEGWSGKLWAVHQGLAYTNTLNAEYVLLTDADIEHDPGHLAALVAKAESGHHDLVSEMVRLHCETLAERALIPAFVFFFQMLYPFASVGDPHNKTAGAAGGTMLVRRTALDRIDGVQRIRHHLIDDCALAREIQSTGGSLWLGHAELARSLRVYPDWVEVWDMIARTAYVQLGYSPLVLLGCTAGMALLYLAPPALAILAHGASWWLGAAAWVAMALAFQPTLRRYRRNPMWGFALPGIAMFYLGATFASAIRHHAGRGGGWKNRTYPEAPSA